MNPIRFALVTTSYPPIIGGSETEAQRVCAALQARGHQPLVICPGGAPMPRLRAWIDPAGVPVRLYGHSGPARLRGWRYALGVVGALFTAARRARAVYFLMPGLQVALGVPAARLLGKAVLMKFSGANEIRRLRGSLAGRLQLAVLRRWALRIMVLNPAMFEEAAEAGLPVNRLLWMPNPVDTALFAPLAPGPREALRQRLALGAGPVILFVGRLAPEKQLPVLIEAFARVRRSGLPATLLLVGDGPLRSELEAQAAALGASAHVRFAGAVAPSEVHAYMQAADVFTLLSSLEGLPVALLEAMSAGLPAVVSGISANLQVVEDERSGLVVPPGDATAAAAALERLVRDESLRRRLGEAARLDVVARFSTDKVVSAYETLFRECELHA